MDVALDAGVNFFDTANHYPDFVNCGRTEEIIGRWLVQGGSRRERIVLATKVYQPMKDMLDGPNDEPGLSKYKIRRHLEGSLRRLQTDRVELYQMHHIDRRTTWEETWEVFATLVAQGKIDYVGSSNFPGWQLALAQAAARQRHFFGLASEQHRYNLLCRLPELEVLPAAQALGIGVLVYSPLASGLLGGAGPRAAGARQHAGPQLGQLDAFRGLCRELGQLESVVAIAWILHQPAVCSVIIGPRTVEQVRTALSALDVSFDAATIARLNQIFPGFYGRPAPEAYAW